MVDIKEAISRIVQKHAQLVMQFVHFFIINAKCSNNTLYHTVLVCVCFSDLACVLC